MKLLVKLTLSFGIKLLDLLQWIGFILSLMEQFFQIHNLAIASFNQKQGKACFVYTGATLFWRSKSWLTIYLLFG